MGGISPEAELVRSIGAAGYQDAIDTMACLEILSASNSYEVVEGVNAGNAVRAARMVRKALFERVLISIERAYQTKTYKGDRHTRVAFRLLSHQTVFDEVAALGSKPHLQQAQSTWAQYDADPRRKKLKHYRDKVVAHSGELDPTIGVPLIQELVGFAQGTADIWARLARGVGAVGMDLDVQMGAYRDSASAFWGVWSKR